MKAQMVKNAVIVPVGAKGGFVTKRPPSTGGRDRRLELAWLRDRILELPRAHRWQTLARSALRDDLYNTHRTLTAAVLEVSSTSINPNAAIDAWVEASAAAVERYLRMLTAIRAVHGDDSTTLFVAVRELANLIPSSPN